MSYGSDIENKRYHDGPGGTIEKDDSTIRYFTEFTFYKAALYSAAAIYVISVGIVALIQPFLTLPCPSHNNQVAAALTFANPAYDADPCRQMRFALILWLTPEECTSARKLVASVLLGGIIGWERRQADRPAGIRTMSLVSLGSCLFTITSTFAFLNGPMAWDASRVAAAIPSGVGFLGAGLIFKKEQKGSNSTPMVHGLTTAASVWLSAAVGIACGGELYFPASFGTAIMLLLLRFGPRGDDSSKHDDSDDDDDDDEQREELLERKMSDAMDAAGGNARFQNGVSAETKSLLNLSTRAKEKKLRQRANLASIV